MALTPQVQSSQFAVLAATDGTDLQTSQFSLMVAANYASPRMQSSQFAVLAASDVAGKIRASQFAIMVAAIGRPTFKRARSWTFTLDNHDIYVLRIGEQETLIYDLLTDQWAIWKSETRSTWRAHLGQNWIGLAKSNYLGDARTNIVAGDDTFGVLWTLDPASGFDEAPLEGQDDQYFERLVTAGIAMRMRNSPRHNTLFLTIETGNPLPAATEITLRLSDDMGNSFFDAGTVTVQAGEYAQEIMWRSLGLIRQPGRIMEFRDRGATSVLYALDSRVSPGGAYDTEGEV